MSGGVGGGRLSRPPIPITVEIPVNDPFVQT